MNKFLTRFLPGKHGGKERESEPSNEAVIELSHLINHYFPENSSPPRDQISEKFKFIGNIFDSITSEKVELSNVHFDSQSEEAIREIIPEQRELTRKYFISTDSLIPVIYEKPGAQAHFLTKAQKKLEQLDSESSWFHIFMKPLNGPDFNMSVNFSLDEFHKILIQNNRTSGRLTEMHPPSYGFSEDTRIFAMQNTEDLITVNNLNGKNDSSVKIPYWIIEKGEPCFKTPTVSIRLAVDTSDDSEKIQQFTSMRDLFKFVFKPGLGSNVEDVISWNSENAKISFRDNEIRISSTLLQKLNQSMNLTNDDFKTIFNKALTVQNRFPYAIRTFDINPHTFAKSLYLLNLLKVTAKMINQATSTVQDETKPLISDNTIEEIKKRLDRYKRQGRQFALNSLLWMGFDIWNDVDDIIFQLTSAASKNPKMFSEYYAKLGLDNQFLDYRIGKIDTFGLFDVLDQYYDHRPGKEFSQSELYFMNICLALAWHAESIGEEPFGCVIVKDGKIIGAGHNEIEMHHGDHTRHAEIIAIERAKNYLLSQNIPKEQYQKQVKELEGCMLYTTASPCEECTFIIRKHGSIDSVIVGVASEMEGEALRNSLLSKVSIFFDRPPESKTPNISKLRAQFYDLYIRRKGWDAMFRTLFLDPDSSERPFI